MSKKAIYGLLSFILVVAITIIAIFYGSTTENDEEYNSLVINEDYLNIFFFDVGQADSTLIMKNGRNMLIDGGNDWDGERLTNYLRSLGVERIDYLVATHLHADHIGGLDTIIENFEIGNVRMPI